MTRGTRRKVGTTAGKRMLLARQVIAFQSWFSAGLWVAQAMLFTGDWAISSIQTLMLLPLPELLRNERYDQIYTICQRITFYLFCFSIQKAFCLCWFVSFFQCTAISHEWEELSSGHVGSWAASSDNRRANKNSSPQDLIWISNMSTWKRYKINHLNSQCKLQSDPKFPFSLMYLQQWQSTDQTFNSLFPPNTSWIFQRAIGCIFWSPLFTCPTTMTYNECLALQILKKVKSWFCLACSRSARWESSYFGLSPF